MLVTGSQKSTVLKGTTFVDTLLGWGVRLNSDGSVTEDITKIAHESMFGNAGNDKLYGGAGNDKLYGEVGDDLLNGGTGLDKLYGGSGNDKLYGGVGNDLLDGGIGADQLNGEDGDDQLYGGDGNDLLNGDTIDNYPVEARVLFKPLYVGGNDTIYGGAGDDIINGDGGSYYPTVNEFAIVQQVSEGGDDILYGGTGNDTINGEGGNDRLYGEGGNDSLNGGSGDDLLSGGGGNNYLTGGEGADTFVASAGFDVISDFSPAFIYDSNVVIDFEGVTTADFSPIFNGYCGLNWSGEASVADQSYNFYPGVSAVLTSGMYIGVNDYANVAATFENPTADFDLISGYFASLQNYDNTLTVTAYDDNAVVGTATIVLDPVKVFVDFSDITATGADSSIFTGRFTSIDKVQFVGTPVFGGWIAADDLTLAYATPGEGDLLDLPLSANVAAMIAGATSDGNGGTILNTGIGTIDLVGIEPSEVSADWFV